MERWLSFLAEYNFRVKYKPGKLNVLPDAFGETTDLYDRIRSAYQVDENYTPLMRFLSDGNLSRMGRWVEPLWDNPAQANKRRPNSAIVVVA
ncbi:Hypothetical protein PHPALM_17097 [Phytophthora palmivora]|uniref:Uncharacterized protein n=1 Tax=Phytophthora palmivora TaxID=4796 RepID=A0A2P4XN60_9STRA|nr:Hypothetical protein PHPALM_17097 [Phytophthora palmivora]